MKKHWDKIILGAVIFSAAAIRLYHFRDWLFFAMDQARDAMLVRGAFENGLSYLPLLGPRAAGTYLRLGPMFYYFQYLSAKITNSLDPEVFAYPDLLFSILSIPLLYFFLRINFSKFVSLLVSTVYAFSFIAIQYSRFAWNPNSIPFWTLVCFYGLLRFSSTEGKSKFIWLTVATIGFSVVGQLHFIAFLAMPLIIFFYLFVTKGFSRMSWKGVLLVAAIVLFFYSPMILSEISTKGNNLHQFLFALKSKPQEHSLFFGIYQNILMHGKYYFMFLSSYTSKSYYPSLFSGLILIAGGVFLAGSHFFRGKVKENKNFSALVIIWITISFLMLIPFSSSDEARFFFLTMPLPFIFFAFWLSELLKMKKYRKITPILFIVLALILVVFNVEATLAWYGGLERNTDPLAFRNRRLEIKQAGSLRFTSDQVKDVSEYLYSEWQKNGKRVLITANASYRVPIQYLLEAKDPLPDFGILVLQDNDPNDLYYSVRLSDRELFIARKFQEKFDPVSSRRFGALTVYQIKFKDPIPEEPDESIEPTEEEAEDAESQPETPPAPKAQRMERVFWKDVLKR